MGSRVKSGLQRRAKPKTTHPERIMASILKKADIRFTAQAVMPGTPDFHLHGTRVLIFVDGNFYHGFNFSSWRHRLPARWRAQIADNMQHDVKITRQLRAAGWKVVRIWEYELVKDPRAVLLRVTAALG